MGKTEDRIDLYTYNHELSTVHIHKCTSCGVSVDVIQKLGEGGDGFDYFCTDCELYMESEPILFRSQGREWKECVVPMWYVHKTNSILLQKIGRFSIWSYEVIGAEHIMIYDNKSQKMVHSVVKYLGWDEYLDDELFPFTETDLESIANDAAQLDNAKQYEYWFTT